MLKNDKLWTFFWEKRVFIESSPFEFGAWSKRYKYLFISYIYGTIFQDKSIHKKNYISLLFWTIQNVMYQSNQLYIRFLHLFGEKQHGKRKKKEKKVEMKFIANNFHFDDSIIVFSWYLRRWTASAKRQRTKKWRGKGAPKKRMSNESWCKTYIYIWSI